MNVNANQTHERELRDRILKFETYEPQLKIGGEIKLVPNRLFSGTHTQGYELSGSDGMLRKADVK
jgi:hypothetical protein